MEDLNLIGTKEAAEVSGLSEGFICRLMRQGRLEGFRVSGVWLVKTESLKAYLATARRPGPKTIDN